MGEGAGREEWGLKAIDVRNIFRKILTLCTWIILCVDLEGGWGGRFDHDRWSQNVLELVSGILGDCLRQLPNNPNYLRELYDFSIRYS